MKNLKFILVILLFCGISYAQDQVISQTEEVDIENIQELAKADAKADFNTQRKLGWGGASIVATWGGILSRPALTGWGRVSKLASIIGLMAIPIASQQMPVNLPEERERELSSKNGEYEAIYREAYRLAIKRLRFKYSLGSSVASLGVAVVTELVIGILLMGSWATSVT